MQFCNLPIGSLVYRDLYLTPLGPKQEGPKPPFFPSKLALAILSSDSYNSTQLENPENIGFNRFAHVKKSCKETEFFRQNSVSLN